MISETSKTRIWIVIVFLMLHSVYQDYVEHRRQQIIGEMVKELEFRSVWMNTKTGQLAISSTEGWRSRNDEWVRFVAPGFVE